METRVYQNFAQERWHDNASCVNTGTRMQRGMENTRWDNWPHLPK